MEEELERRRKMALESSGESASRKELLASVRRLTIAVLDNLEQGVGIRLWTRDKNDCSAVPGPDYCGYGGIL
jgi:hypothetical protein